MADETLTIELKVNRTAVDQLIERLKSSPDFLQKFIERFPDGDLSGLFETTQFDTRLASGAIEHTVVLHLSKSLAELVAAFGAG